MTFLYPRLLHAPAKTMAGEYRDLPIDELALRATSAHDSAVYAATGGDRALPAKLAELRRLVLTHAEDMGMPGELTNEKKTQFDQRLAVLLHTEMGMVPAEAASGDVWAFLALVLLPDVAHWRYPHPPVDRVLRTDLTRHVFGRLWWRAQLVHATGEQHPYKALSILGEAAFDQIYARRAALGGSPQLVKGILRVWDRLDLTGMAERETLQDFLKRLLRLAPFVLFEAMDERALDGELVAVARETVTALLRKNRFPEDWISDKIALVFARTDTLPEIPVLPDVVVHREEAEQAIVDTDLDPEPELDRGAILTVTEPTGIQAYKAYEGPSFGDPREIGLQELADAIATVVAVEGPVLAERVYRIITSMSGGRLRDNARNALVDATRYAKRGNKIDAENQRGRRGFSGATLRLPDQPLSVLRERGSRELDEIPERELAAAARFVIQDGTAAVDREAIARATSKLFGYERCTQNFREAVSEALDKYPA